MPDGVARGLTHIAAESNGLGLGRTWGRTGTVIGVRVWIDQDLCTGDGLCVDHCPDVFVQLEDGIAYVAERGDILNDPGGSGSLASVSPRHVVSVLEAAEVCPGECIFIDIDDMDTDLMPAADVVA